MDVLEVYTKGDKLTIMVNDLGQTLMSWEWAKHYFGMPTDIIDGRNPGRLMQRWMKSRSIYPQGGASVTTVFFGRE